jgi:hypothetical protein
METSQSFHNNQLHVEVEQAGEAVRMRFLGKSMLREPGEFLLPLLLKMLAEAIDGKKRIVLDFRDLAYMNSSTLTPVIKILERARVGRGEITLVYRKALKWQDISFSALVIFQTPDGRIAIHGEA